MATPVAAGSLALVREYFLRGLYRGLSWSPSSALLRAVAATSGLPLGGTIPQTGSSAPVTVTRPPSFLQGFG